jgi:hypothetical protein
MAEMGPGLRRDDKSTDQAKLRFETLGLHRLRVI